MNLITGGAGTIGKEFAKQLLEKGKEVLVVDNNEWAVAQMLEHPNLKVKLMDFRDIVGHFDLVIHCAAYKHVDIIENNQDTALLNNVLKTQELYKNIYFKKLLFISTDKAVEPSSYYGITKKEGEEITKRYGGIIARLGNVMSSNGSVIPKWERCIDDGVPLPITDINMTRYMIPVDEAVDKILNLLPHARDGQIIIPSMGKPINILDMAKELCKKRNVDFNYEVIGIRPGEKLNEKLKWNQEKVTYKNINGEILE